VRTGETAPLPPQDEAGHADRVLGAMCAKPISWLRWPRSGPHAPRHHPPRSGLLQCASRTRRASASPASVYAAAQQSHAAREQDHQSDQGGPPGHQVGDVGAVAGCGDSDARAVIGAASSWPNRARWPAPPSPMPCPGATAGRGRPCAQRTGCSPVVPVAIAEAASFQQGLLCPASHRPSGRRRRRSGRLPWSPHRSRTLAVHRVAVAVPSTSVACACTDAGARDHELGCGSGSRAAIRHRRGF